LHQFAVPERRFALASHLRDPENQRVAGVAAPLRRCQTADSSAARRPVKGSGVSADLK